MLAPSLPRRAGQSHMGRAAYPSPAKRGRVGERSEPGWGAPTRPASLRSAGHPPLRGGIRRPIQPRICDRPPPAGEGLESVAPTQLNLGRMIQAQTVKITVSRYWSIAAFGRTTCISPNAVLYSAAIAIIEPA